MFGAICGDVLGSGWDFAPTKAIDFPLYPESSTPTDDAVCTAAIASSLLRGRGFAEELRAWAGASPGANWGPRFVAWTAEADDAVGDSYGHGAHARVSAIPALADDLGHALALAAGSARTSHGHPEAIRSAMAVVAAGRLLLEGWESAAMGRVVGAAFGYDLDTPLAAYRAGYGFEAAADATAHPCLRAVVEATSFEDGVRRVVSMGGAASAMAATVGGVVQFAHPVPGGIRAFVEPRLPRAIRQVLDAYERAVVDRPVIGAPRDAVPDLLRDALGTALAPPAPPARGPWWRRASARG